MVSVSLARVAALCTWLTWQLCVPGSCGSSVYLTHVAALCIRLSWELWVPRSHGSLGTWSHGICVAGLHGSSVYPAHVVALCTWLAWQLCVPRLAWQLCVPGSRGSLGTWSHSICVPDSEAFRLKEATLRGCRRIREALSRPLGLALPGVPPVWGLHLLTCSTLSRADPSALWSSWLGHSPGVGDSVLHSGKAQVSPPVKGGPGASTVCKLQIQVSRKQTKGTPFSVSPATPGRGRPGWFSVESTELSPTILPNTVSLHF